MSNVRFQSSGTGSPSYREPVVKKEPVINSHAVTCIVQTVRCPTCGSLAERRLLSSCQASIGEYCVRTACEACDYLLVSGSLTGKVLEAYAPGQEAA